MCQQILTLIVAILIIREIFVEKYKTGTAARLDNQRFIKIHFPPWDWKKKGAEIVS